MDLAPVLGFWAFVLLALIGDGRGLVYLLFASLPFGSFAVVPPAITGGLTFSPATMVSLIFSARVLLTPQSLGVVREAAYDFRRLGLLMLFWCTAVVVTLFAPRLFAGRVEVIEMRATLLVLRSVALQPTTQNITQLCYLTVSVGTTLAFASALSRPGWWKTILQAMLLGGVVTIVTGLMDMAPPLSAVLAPFRTATYALLTDVEVMGVKRLVGLMPEASAYGALCVGFVAPLHFLGPLIQDSWLRERVRPVVVLGLVAMAALSTSSAAFVALAVFTAIAVLEWGWRLLNAQTGRTADLARLGREAWFGLIVGCAGVLALIVNPDIARPGLEMLDQMVFQKTASSSFAERSMWTAVSWHALWQTYGVGVGLGGTRASNAFVAIASNTGVLGATFFYGFVLWHLLRPLPRALGPARSAATGARWALAPGFTVGLLVGTSANFGVMGALYFAILAMAVPALARSAARGRQLTDLRAYRQGGSRDSGGSGTWVAS